MSLLKFDGRLTLQKAEENESIDLPAKVFQEKDKRHTVILFNFNKDNISFYGPALSILIDQVQMDPFAVDVIGYQGDPIANTEKPDSQSKAWLVRFEWSDKEAIITTLEEIKR